MRPLLLCLVAGCSASSIDLGKDPKDDTTPETVGTEPAPATAPIYAHGADGLYTWSAADGPTLIGSFVDTDSGVAINGMTDIAIDSEGGLYGAYNAGLYRVDPTDGACTYQGTLPESGTGLTFLPDGRLLVAGMSLVAYDLDSGASEELVATAVWATSGDVVAVPDGSIHWSVVLPGTDGWVRVEPSLGSAELVGEVGVSSLWGVAYAEDTLYAFSADGTSWEIDPATGAGTLVRTDSVGWYGATTNPVSW